MVARRIALLFSLFLCGLAWAQPSTPADLVQRARAAKSEQEFETVMNEARDQGCYDNGKGNRQTKQEILEFWANSHVANDPTLKGASKVAADYKKEQLYTDTAKRQESNWLKKLLDRLKRKESNKDSNSLSMPTFGTQFVTQLVNILLYVLAILLTIVVAYFILKPVFEAARTKRKLGLLEEGEPERTEDEWLALGSQLEAEGRFREAVRAYYLATLLALDGANVLRFIGTQTNWEHLARFRALSSPPAVPLYELTKSFDPLWYGGRTVTAEHALTFKQGYVQTKQVLSAKGADE